MKTEELNLLEFQKKFSNEEKCARYLFQKRWPEGFKCPICGHAEYYYISTRKLYECKDCGHQTSITAGTVMHRTKLKLTIWFWALYLVTNDKRGCSALSISRMLDLNYRTAWRLLHKIRHAMAERDSKYILSDFIEMDDAFFGAPHPKTDGRGTKKTPVAIALSTDEKGNPLYVRMKVIEAVTTKQVKKFTSENVKKGSKITTDGYTSYRQLKEDYIHKYQNYYELKDTDFLKYLHIIISNAKAYILGTYHGLGEKNMQSYLDEFCYRFNRRFNSRQLFGRVLNACIFSDHYVVPE